MSDLGSMDRTRSAPALSRSMSAATFDGSLQRSATVFSDWQSMSQDTVNSYALYSDTSMRNQQNQLIADATPLVNGSMVEYSPVEYINNCIEPDSSAHSLSLPQNSQQLHVQLTPNLQWSPSSDGSTSPSTPSTALMTPITQSNDLSRQSSCNPPFIDNVSMLRTWSDSSCMLPILPEDGLFSFPYDVESKPISSNDDGAHFLNITGHPSEAFFSPVSQSVSASAYALASSQHEQSDLVEDMQRSASTYSSGSSTSNASASSSTASRQSRRDREINAQAASRKIAPKAIESNDETESAPSNAQMARIRSEDGSSKTVGLLTKAPYVRPQHPKIMCKHCNERPDGFRGTHELDRHVARAHSAMRKGYICVDNSSDRKFLANCKHCRNKKVYGAYYNAAAHLRRAHFHPRKRGRKGKNDEKRGGIGGGDDPPMDFLKQFWIQEVDVDNKPLPKSPESAPEDAPESVDNAFDATFEIDDSASYPQQQMPLSMNTQAPLDANQFMAYGSSMNVGEHMVMYDNAAFATYDTSAFEFDAYVSQ